MKKKIKKTDYEKQRAALLIKVSKGELTSNDLIDMLVETRKYRDETKNTLKKFKTANHNLSNKILSAGIHLKKIQKQLTLN
jgi:hypothetical protein